jgi:hypothetical protein
MRNRKTFHLHTSTFHTFLGKQTTFYGSVTKHATKEMNAGSSAQYGRREEKEARNCLIKPGR